MSVSVSMSVCVRPGGVAAVYQREIDVRLTSPGEGKDHRPPLPSLLATHRPLPPSLVATLWPLCDHSGCFALLLGFRVIIGV